MNLKSIKKSSFFSPWLIVLLFLNFGCKETLPKKEAEKQMKAFDNELIVIYDQLSKSEGYHILNYLLTINDLPIPLLNLVQSNSSGASVYQFEAHTGVYRVDTTTNSASWSTPSDSIIVVFPYRSKNDSVAYMELTGYTEALTRWGSVMPTSLLLKIKASDIVLFQIRLKGEVKHDIPTKMNLELSMDNYRLEANLRSLLNKRKARFYINLTVETLEKKIITFAAYMLHDVTNPDQSVLEKTKIHWKTFPVDIELKMDNKSFDPSTHNFIQEFNEHTTIQINSQLNGASLGEVKLENRNGMGKLNYSISFEDGTSVFFDDLLLAYKYLMNARYPDVPISRK